MCPELWECPRQSVKCPRQWVKCPRQWGEMSATVGGNVHNSGEIEYALRNVRLKIVIHMSA